MSKDLEKFPEHVVDIPDSTSCRGDDTGHCPTCADEVLTATVLYIASPGLAMARINDTSVGVDISLVENIKPGDRLLVHAGVAISHAE
jgi:hypothetical protein